MKIIELHKYFETHCKLLLLLLHELSLALDSLSLAESTDYGHPMKSQIKEIWKFGPLWQTKYALAVPKNLELRVEQWRQLPHRASVVCGGTKPLELHLQKQAMCTIWNSCKNKMPIWLKKANKGGSYTSWYTGFTFTCQVSSSFFPPRPLLPH